jgi:type 1 glutamine amidotransferase
MKPQHWFRLWALAALAFLCISAQAAEPIPKIKVLLITGGHGFEREAFFEVFKSNPEIALAHAEHAASSATAYEREDLLDYHTVVLYDMPQVITDQQKAKFLSLFQHGTGLLVLHHALVSYQTWPNYERIIGGRYREPDPKKPGTVTEQAGWQHDVEFTATIVAKNHPVTTGLKDFVILDEIYWGYQVRPDVTPLLSTTHPKSGKPLAWTRSEGNSRVVYLQLGHGPSAYRNENYRRLVAQSIRWVAQVKR